MVQRQSLLAPDFKILVVEDDPDIKQMTKAFLKQRFSHIVDATDIREAMDGLKAQKIDVILCDIHLPGGDGVEFFHILKTMPPPMPKVIFVTGDSRYVREEAMAHGAAEFFYKPYHAAELMTAVTRTIGRILVITDQTDGSDALCQSFEDQGFYVEVIALRDSSMPTPEPGNFDLFYFDLKSYAKNETWASVVDQTRAVCNVFQLPILMACDKNEMESLIKATHGRVNDVLSRDFGMEYNLIKVKNGIISKRRDDELTQSRNQALEGMRLKSMFLANMSHEIRTPLYGIIGVVSMLDKTKLDNEQRDFVSIIQRSGLRLQRILNDILDFSKIEAKNVVLEGETFDLRDTIEQVTLLFVANAKLKKISLCAEIDEKVPHYVKSDALRLQQVLSNLVNNALKFTSEGGVRVKVSVRPVHVEGADEVLFEVIDTGIGMTNEEIQRLFKSFSQANYSTTKVYGGTGLGLSISKQLVTLFKGDIGVKSQKGIGSNFWFSIPLARPNEEEIKVCKVNIEAQKRAENAHLDLTSKTILIVDDDEINRRVLGKMIERSHAKCLFAESGEKAIELLGSHDQIDLVFLDCHMPVMDGYETARQIVAKFGKKAPPLVAFTADAFPENRVSCIEAGMSDVVTKPLDLQVINTVVNKWTGGL